VTDPATPVKGLNGSQPRPGARLPEGTPVPADTVMVDIASLVFEDSPRSGGEDTCHTQALAEADNTLPPIMVHRQTMRVIDGMHRVQAARLRGRKKIIAVYFDGDVEASFVKAVEANVSHGLPLSLQDRKAAAKRIMRSFPAWSDRAIAASTGLSATTIRTMRGSAPAHVTTRLGRDGRVRPLSAAEGRRRAARVLAERPDTPLRAVAHEAGVSVGTARDVRNRMRDGEGPLPPTVRLTETADAAGGGRHRAGAVPRARDARKAHGRPPALVLKALKLDPSLRYSEKGRLILRWLDAHLLDPATNWLPFADDVPPHCRYLITELATGCAQAWADLAAVLRTHTDQP
jgi:ParB-like chromosome segregation protein Spo0J